MPGLTAKYFYNAPFDQAKLQVGLSKFFATEPLARNHTEATPASLLRVINQLATDTRVTDIRWMAYMLATITKEARLLVRVPVISPKTQQPVVNPKTNKPQTKALWQIYDPIS